MKIRIVLYGFPLQLMPRPTGRTGTVYGTLHWNDAKRRHEGEPMEIADYRKMLPDLAESTTGERWLIDFVDEPKPEPEAHFRPVETAPPLPPQEAGGSSEPDSAPLTDLPAPTAELSYHDMRSALREKGIQVGKLDAEKMAAKYAEVFGSGTGATT